LSPADSHEIYFNFSSYKSRLHMPSVASNATLEGAMYYSYDAGCVHFVSLSSESPSDSPLIQADQVAWLATDLEAFEARRVAGRLNRKDGDDDECTYAAPTFAVVFIHRPLYCSAAGKEGTERCGTQAAYLRSQIEGLLVQYKVDLVFSGHVHAYG
jgi:3',5'-cyclic AMP phosphodiesterase CpdA